MKKILLSILILSLSGCSVTFNYENTIDYGYSKYYKIQDSNICFGSTDLGDGFVSRIQVSCDTIPKEKVSILNIENEKEGVFIQGVGQLSDKNLEGVFYFHDKKICKKRDENSFKESSCIPMFGLK